MYGVLLALTLLVIPDSSSVWVAGSVRSGKPGYPFDWQVSWGQTSQLGPMVVRAEAEYERDTGERYFDTDLGFEARKKWFNFGGRSVDDREHKVRFASLYGEARVGPLGVGVTEQFVPKRQLLGRASANWKGLTASVEKGSGALNGHVYWELRWKVWGRLAIVPFVKGDWVNGRELWQAKVKLELEGVKWP